MQPKSRKKLNLMRETVRSLTHLGPAELRTVVGGISIATMCNSKDLRCPNPTGGVTCNSLGNCPSGNGAQTCECTTLATCECTAAAC
jgi:hypothetical protein